jgi:hypothetical protein
VHLRLRVQEGEEVLTSEEAVYQRVIELLLQQHQLAWSS